MSASAPSKSEILANGLWRNNTGLVALLGLCPLLATSSSAVNGLGLGLATVLVLLLTNTTIALIRSFVPNEVRIPVFIVVIASAVTAVELAMHAFLPELHKVLGIFIPLIVTNCCVLGRAESFASKNAPALAALDGVATGLGFTLVLTVLGSLREFVGQGTLFANADIMFGEAGRMLTVQVLHDYRGFLLAILPPGAFIGLALLIAGKNWLDARTNARTAATPVEAGCTPEAHARA